jgi:hypothetical protein
MFNFFKKQQSLPSAEEISALTSSATEDIKSKWIYYNQTIQFKAEIPLSEKIGSFLSPIYFFLQDKYPLLIEHSPEICWLAAVAAIFESGTHPVDELNLAFKEFMSKDQNP